jgi:hypothetical protein
MRPLELRTKNECTGKDQQQFAQQINRSTGSLEPAHEAGGLL